MTVNAIKTAIQARKIDVDGCHSMNQRQQLPIFE
jgi:hypothetical protein